MKKYVYLFELDSIRNSPSQIKIGQEAMLYEIIEHGNTVIMTYNQFVDNIGFLTLLQNSEYCEKLLELFKNKSILISQFGDIRNISYYLLNSLNKAYENNTKADFRFAGLPINSNQKRLISLVIRSLEHTDLTEIKEYIDTDINKAEEYERLKDLFLETDQLQVKHSKLNYNEMLDICTQLHKILSLIFNLSTLDYIYLSPKDPEEYKDLHLTNFINTILNYEKLDNNLKNILNESVQNDSRSQIYLNIEAMSEKYSTNDIQKAKYIVDLAYNYASEASICNISKHYNIIYDKENNTYQIDQESFFDDFTLRFNKLILDSQNEEEKSIDEFKNKLISRIDQAARISGYNKKTFNIERNINRYEKDLSKQKSMQKRTIRKQSWHRLISLLAIIVFIFIFEIATDLFHSAITGDFEFATSLDSLGDVVGKTILFLITGEITSQLISMKIKGFIPLSEIAINLGKLCKDVAILFKKNQISHKNEDGKYNNNDPISVGQKIKYIIPPSLKKYKAYNNKTDADSEIANLNNEKILENVIKNGELYGNKYGVAHEGKDTTIIIEPVGNAKSYSSKDISPREKSINKNPI